MREVQGDRAKLDKQPPQILSRGPSGGRALYRRLAPHFLRLSPSVSHWQLAGRTHNYLLNTPVSDSVCVCFRQLPYGQQHSSPEEEGGGCELASNATYDCIHMITERAHKHRADAHALPRSIITTCQPLLSILIIRAAV